MNEETTLWACWLLGGLNMPLNIFNCCYIYSNFLMSFWSYGKRDKCVNLLWPFWQIEEDAKNRGSGMNQKLNSAKKTWITLLILVEYPIYSLHITFSFFSMNWLLCPFGNWLCSMWPPLNILISRKSLRSKHLHQTWKCYTWCFT